MTALLMPDEAVLHKPYTPHGVQLDLFKSTRRQVLLSGPAGTGKSRACLEKVHWACRKFPGLSALIVRKTQKSLTNTALKTFEEYVAKQAFRAGKVSWYGGSSRYPAAYQYRNGSSINVGGMDEPDKIMSSEYGVAYVQEATELDEDHWQKLSTRMRNPIGMVDPVTGQSYRQLIADCNPGPPDHWLKQRADEDSLLMLNTRHEENPVYFNEDETLTPLGHEYMATLDALTGVQYYRLRKGLWVAAEGVIYEEFDPAVHVIAPFDVPDEWAHWWAIDFGMTNPFVWQNWVMNPDGVLFLIQEIYRTNTLVQDHAAEIHWLTEGQRAPQAIITDHDPDGQGTLHRELGLRTRGVFGSKAPISAYKKVKEGIEAVKVRLRSERVFFFKGTVSRRDQSLVDRRKPTCTVEELPGYIWAEQKTVGSPKDEPLKENDHGVDALRYMVAHLDLVGRPSLRFVSS